MSGHAPRVSVVIPTFNRREELSRCLRALAAQDYRDVEIIVVDDGSGDDLTELASAFPGVRLLSQSHRGAAAARNFGVREARGTLVAFTDDDCIPEPGWLAAGVARLDDDTVAAVEGRTVCVEPDYSPTSIPMVNHHGGKFATCNMIYRRRAILEAGGFAEDELPFLGEDRDLAFRVRRLGTIVFEPAARVAHPIRHYSLRAFIRYHLRLRQTYWQVRFLRHSRTRLTWETAIAYPVLAAAALAVARPEIGTLLLAGVVYGVGAVVHDFTLTKCTVQDGLRHRWRLAGWVAAWWLVMAHDLVMRLAGIIRFRRIVL